MLEGLRVLDLIDGMGAYAGRLLAGLGAEVILVEPSGGHHRRSRLRRYRAVNHADADGASPGLYFLHYDAGKSSITLNPSSAEGLGVLDRLLHSMDIVLDNGHLASWGFDLEGLTARRRLVIVSVTPFGLSGPRADWQGGDLICQAMGGMIALYGYRDERPMRFGEEQASEMAGMAAALSALVATYGARAEGVGEVVDLAVQRVAAMVPMQLQNASMYHQFGVVKSRRPRSQGGERMYRTRDGFVSFSVAREPRRAVEVLDRLGVGEEIRALLQEHGEQGLVASGLAETAVARAVQGLSRDQVTEAAQAAGVMSLPVYDAGDVARDPFLQERAFFVDVECPEVGSTLTNAALPFLVDGRRFAHGRRAPLLGEHTTAVLASVGLEASEIEHLRAMGVC